MTPGPDEPVPVVTGEDVRRRTVSGLGWMFLSGGGQVALQILVLAVLARYVSPAEFGIASAALVVMALTAVFTEAGVGTALVQRPDITSRHIRTAWTFQVLVAVALWAGLSLGAQAIGALFGIPEVADVTPVITLALVLQSLTVGGFLLQRDMRFRTIATIEFTSWAVGYGGVAITLAVLGMGVWSIVLGNVAQALLGTVQLWIRRPHSVRPLLDRPALRQLLFFGGGYTLGWWANFVARQGDNFVVGRWLGAAALGLYTRAYSLMRQPAVLFGRVVSSVLFPAMAAVQDDRQRLRSTYLRGVMLVGLVVLPFTVATAMLSTELITVLLGERWLEVRGAFNIMVFGMLFRTSSKLSDALTTATGHVYQRALRQGVYAVMVVGGALMGRAHGIQGVSVAILVALGVNFALMARLGLVVTEGTWAEFLRAHLPGAILAIVVAAPTALVVRSLRGAQVADGLVLVAGAAVTGVIATATLRLAPRLALTRPVAGSVEDVLRILRPGSRLHRVTRRVVGRGYGLPTEAVLERAT